MHRTNNRKGRRNAAQRQQSEFAKMSAALKAIKTMEKEQIPGTLPGVPDVDQINIQKDKVYSMWKSVSLPTVTTSTTLGTAIGYIFRLSDSNDAVSLGSCFEQFRIAQVTISFIPQAIGSNSTSQPALSTCIDYDDASTPSSLSSILENDTSKTTMVGHVHTRVLNPQLVTSVYNGAFAAYANLPRNTWVDSVYTNTDFYGLKLYMPSTAVVQSYTVIAKYLLQFRRPN